MAANRVQRAESRDGRVATFSSMPSNGRLHATHLLSRSRQRPAAACSQGRGAVGDTPMSCPAMRKRRTPVCTLVLPQINFIGVLRGCQCHIRGGADRARGDGVVPVEPAARRTAAAGHADRSSSGGVLRPGGAGAAMVPRRHSASATRRRQRDRPVHRLPVSARGIDVLAARRPSLRSALLAAKAAEHSHVNLDGTLIETDRVAAPGPTPGADLWWSGKHHQHGGNHQPLPGKA